MRKLIIATNSASSNKNFAAAAGERDAITGFLQGKGWNVWHWFEDVWLVLVEENDPISVTDLQNELQKVMGKQRNLLVIEAKAGCETMGTVNNGAIPWLQNQWGLN